MLAVNQHYRIGGTHQVCEDYSLQGELPQPFVVVCDGCSSAIDSDIGARLLAHMAKRMFMESKIGLLDYDDFGQRVIRAAESIAQAMALSHSALDATLLMAWTEQETVRVFAYGDGCLLLRDKQGKTRALELRFRHNAPYYLAYQLREEWREEYSRGAPPQALEIHDSGSQQIERREFDDALEFRFSLADYPLIGIATDGLTQFRDVHQQQNQALSDVAATLLNFQRFSADFVQRRLNKAWQRYAEAGIYPLDDVALGVLADIAAC